MHVRALVLLIYCAVLLGSPGLVDGAPRTACIVADAPASLARILFLHEAVRRMAVVVAPSVNVSTTVVTCALNATAPECLGRTACDAVFGPQLVGQPQWAAARAGALWVVPACYIPGSPYSAVLTTPGATPALQAAPSPAWTATVAARLVATFGWRNATVLLPVGGSTAQDSLAVLLATAFRTALAANSPTVPLPHRPNAAAVKAALDGARQHGHRGVVLATDDAATVDALVGPTADSYGGPLYDTAAGRGMTFIVLGPLCAVAGAAWRRLPGVFCVGPTIDQAASEAVVGGLTVQDVQLSFGQVPPTWAVGSLWSLLAVPALPFDTAFSNDAVEVVLAAWQRAAVAPERTAAQYLLSGALAVQGLTGRVGFDSNGERAAPELLVTNVLGDRQAVAAGTYAQPDFFFRGPTELTFGGGDAEAQASRSPSLAATAAVPSSSSALPATTWVLVGLGVILLGLMVTVGVLVWRALRGPSAPAESEGAPVRRARRGRNPLGSLGRRSVASDAPSLGGQSSSGWQTASTGRGVRLVPSSNGSNSSSGSIRPVAGPPRVVASAVSPPAGDSVFVPPAALEERCPVPVPVPAPVLPPVSSTAESLRLPAPVVVTEAVDPLREPLGSPFFLGQAPDETTGRCAGPIVLPAPVDGVTVVPLPPPAHYESDSCGGSEES